MLSRILLVLSVWFVAGTGFAQQLVNEASLPRDLSEGRFRLTVTVTGLNNTLVTRGSTDGTGNEQIKARFVIKVTNVGSGDSEGLPITQAEGAADARLAKFYMQEGEPMVTDPSDVTNGQDLHSQRYSIDIIEEKAGSLASAPSNGSVTLSIYFYLGSATNKEYVARTESFVVQRDVYLINAQPGFEGTAPIVGSHKSLIVNWTVQTSVPSLGGNSGNKAPSSVVVYVVHPDVASQGFAAKTFSGTADTADTETTCQYTKPTSTDPAACITCAEKTYLNRAEIKTALGGQVTYATGKNSDGQVKIDGLENDVQYTVFMQYLPDGVGTSQCLPGQPSPNITFTELNGEGDAEVVDFRCFIATAAYGSPMAEDLKYFRKFRSHVLLKSSVGRAFVHYYYEYSPPVAHFIAEHPALRDFVRGILEVPAKMLKSVDEYY